MFDPTVAQVLPRGNRENVAHHLLMLGARGDVSLADLVRNTCLPPIAILSELKDLKRKFGVAGSKKLGYRLSEDPEQRLAMSVEIGELGEARVVRK